MRKQTHREQRNQRIVDIPDIGPWEIRTNFFKAIFKQILVIDDWGIYCKITIRLMSLGRAGDKLTLVLVTAGPPGGKPLTEPILTHAYAVIGFTRS